MGHWPAEGELTGSYEFIICNNTFPGNAELGNSRASLWDSTIRHAFQQWSVSTDGLVNPKAYSSDDCLHRDTNAGILLNIWPSKKWSKAIAALLPVFKSSVSEIYMVNIQSWDDNVVAAFSDFGDNPFSYCFYFEDACTVSTLQLTPFLQKASTDLGGGVIASGVDIVFNGGRVEEDEFGPRGLNLPGLGLSADRDDAPFNTCKEVIRSDFRNYEVTLHEAGHALGLAKYSLGTFLHPEARDELAHPSVADAVLNKDDRVSYLAADEPDCSPHPLDIMAMYALYQSTVP